MPRLIAPCKDCRIDTGGINEFYMVNDDLWQKVAPDDHHRNDYFLCIGCLEKRLGRKLVKNDFQDVPLHWPERFKHSKRLANRLAAT